MSPVNNPSKWRPSCSSIRCRDPAGPGGLKHPQVAAAFAAVLDFLHEQAGR